MLIDDIKKEIVMGEDDGLILSFGEYDEMRQGLIKIKYPNLVVEESQNEYVKSFIEEEKDRWDLKNMMEAHNPRVSMRCPHCGKSLNVGVYPGCEDAIYDGFGGKIASHKKVCDCKGMFFVNRFIVNS